MFCVFYALHQYAPLGEANDGIFHFIRTASLTFTITWLSAIALKKALWWVPGIPQLLGIPILLGRWEGWVRDQLNEEWKLCAVECRQWAWKISYSAWSQTGTETKGVASTLFIDNEHRNYLVSFCEAIPRSKPSDAHHFTVIVDLLVVKKPRNIVFSDWEMVGEYFNDRARDSDRTKGNAGQMHVKWAGRRRHGLGYSPGVTWAMPEPPTYAFDRISLGKKVEPAQRNVEPVQIHTAPTTIAIPNRQENASQ